MKIEVVKREENSLIIRLPGEDHTFCNVLCKTLYEDEHVEAASYVVEHPLIGHPKLYVATKGVKTPQGALIDAAERITKRCGELAKQLEEALKK